MSLYENPKQNHLKTKAKHTKHKMRLKKDEVLEERKLFAPRRD